MVTAVVARRAPLLELMIAGHPFAIAITDVREVLPPQTFSPIPQAPPGVVGALNLRGEVLTGVDLRRCLGSKAADMRAAPAVVTECDGHLFALIVDGVGDILEEHGRPEPVPSTIGPVWRDICEALLPAGERAVLLLDVRRAVNRAAGAASAGRDEQEVTDNREDG